LYNKNGERNKSFDLEDLLKVKAIDLPGELDSYQAMIGGPNDLYLLSNNGSQLKSKWDKVLVPTWFYEPVQVLEGGKTVMNIVTGDGTRPALPGVVLSTYGKGKVLYLSCSLESLYNGNNNPVLKDLITDFISLVTPTPQSFTLKAPSALIANMTNSGKRYVLHLTNWTGNKYEKTHMMEDYIAPVEQVKISLNIPAKKITSVKTLTGSAFSMKKNGNSVEILLPRVGAYEGILINTN